MAELKTKKTKASVPAFIASVKDETQRKDAKALLALFKEATGESPKMWGTAIIGFGQYHYKSERSTQEGDWMMAGFSPRKGNLSIYIIPGFKDYAVLLKKLGPHKISAGSCLYIKRLSDIHLPTLKAIVKDSFNVMKKRYKA